MLHHQELTERQRQVLEFICRFIAKKRYGPTLAPIADHFGFRSSNGAKCHVVALKKKGYIQFEPGVYRSITLTRLGLQFQSTLKCAGDIVAGPPSLAIENRDAFDVQDNLGKPGDVNVTVLNDAYTGIQIAAGDRCTLRPEEKISDGDTVGIRCSGDTEIVFARANATGETFWFESLDPNVDLLAGSEVEVIGRLVGVIRW